MTVLYIYILYYTSIIEDMNWRQGNKNWWK